MAKTGNVSIVGAGIAGLAASIAAAKTGRAATVYERAASFDPVGAGLQLGPNAVGALQELGAWEAVESIASAPPAIHMREAMSGRLIKEIKLGKSFEARFGRPYRVAHRADLHAALLAVARSHASIDIRLGQEHRINENQSDGPVIGADGIWSESRKFLFPESVVVKTHDAIFRKLIPCPARTDVAVQCVNLWLAPGGHVVHYPVGKDQRLNLVAVTQGEKPETHFASSEILQATFKSQSDWTPWPAAYVKPLPQWHLNNTLLIGDAAHGTLPYLAQGAAMALEDAACLAMNDFNFTKFQTSRLARCTKLHHQSLSAGKTYHASGVSAQARNVALAHMPEQFFLSRLGWLNDGLSHS